MIQLQQVAFAYRSKRNIFERFDWRVEEGERWAVLGPSGCGKSSLLYLLSGLRFPQEGVVRIGGERLERPRPRTGLILQDFGLLPWATVRENVRLGLRLWRFYGPDGTHAPSDEKADDLAERADHWLDQLGIMDVAEHYPSQISGGQRQRTAIARTLTLNPDLLLMDEPFASLDAPTRDSLQRYTLQLHAERGLTMVVVTHSIEEAVVLGQKVLLLGRMPNRKVQVFDNSCAGGEGFQNSEEYLRICQELKSALEAAL